ncbi:hypothetical protein ACLB2K_007484 [Fragaria x ananassa]
MVPVRQKRQAFDVEKYQAIHAEVTRLQEISFIREAQYPQWISNVVMVEKANGKWRMCVDFKNLNNACPKDNFPLSGIDQLVDATAGYELLSRMDAYLGYNQIRMELADHEATTFITD